MDIKSPQFLALRNKWYKKLKDEGFQDIENVDHDKLFKYNLGRSSSGARNSAESPASDKNDKVLLRYACNARYFRLVGHLCHDEEFLKATEDKHIYRRVWEMHSDGITYKVIGSTLGIHKETVKKYLRKFMPMLQKLIDKGDDDDASHSD